MKKHIIDFKRGDVARMDGELYTFTNIDGMYAHWTDKDGEIAIGHNMEYTLWDDGIYE